MTRLSPDQFARLVKQHHAAVYRSALRIVMDEATAADVAQDVFVRALRGKVRFDKARDPVATLCWLSARLAQNANRASRRRRNHEENAMQRPNSDRTGDPAMVAADHDLQAAVQRTVTQLPDELRVPLQLHCADEWTLAAVGAALQLSTSTVHDRVKQALERLRAQLQGRGFAVTAAAMPNLVRDLPEAVVPEHNCSQLAMQQPSLGSTWFAAS
jgi:RNA polymerase sigma-70 factor, ECF subfamily